LLNGLENLKVKDLTMICAIAACAERGSSIQGLLQKNMVKKLVTSHVGENALIVDQFKKGQLEVDLQPLGTLVEKARCGGFGIPGSYTQTGVGTFIEEGGVPTMMSTNGKTVISVNLAKQKREFKGKECLFERSFSSDFALVKAWKCDTKGNAVLKPAFINTNPDFAVNGKICIVEADEVVEPGKLDGDDIHISGIFVHRILKAASLPVKPAGCCMGKTCEAPNEFMARRAAKEIKNGDYVVLGPGMASHVDKFAKEVDAYFVYPQTGVFGALHTEASSENMVDGCMNPIKLRKNAAICRTSDAFSGVRGKHMNMIIVDGYQVSKEGDLANIECGDRVFPSPGVLMDLAACSTPLVVLMPMTAKYGPTLVDACKFKVSGRKCVNKVITEAGVFDFRGGKLTLAEMAPGFTVEQIRSMTKCKIQIADDLKFTKLD
jgi:3-oxoacid CoA-transferase